MTSASFLMGDERRTFARYQEPSENLADTRSPAFGVVGMVGAALLWCREKSLMSFSREAIPGEMKT